MSTMNATKELTESLVDSHKVEDDLKRKVLQFKDLMDKLLLLDPSKRLSVNQALTHPFITERMQS
jgi:serine/threonine-protein kinase PRP4